MLVELLCPFCREVETFRAGLNFLVQIGIPGAAARIIQILRRAAWQKIKLIELRRSCGTVERRDLAHGRERAVIGRTLLHDAPAQVVTAVGTQVQLI